MESKVHSTIRSLPPDERPYEKCFRFGAGSLSDSELLAVLLRTGDREHTSIDISREILRLSDGSYSLYAIHKKSIEELMRIPGIGRVKAITVKCIAELSKRSNRLTFNDKESLNSPSLIAARFMEDMRFLQHEEVRLLSLNGANKYIADDVLSKGTVNKALISTREIFKTALSRSAVNIVLLHNHPGGDPKPSIDDVEVTKKVKNAGILMDIDLLDHIIIGSESYVSLKECGYL